MPHPPGKRAASSPMGALAALDWRSEECRFDRPAKEVIDFGKGEVAIDTLNDVSTAWNSNLDRSSSVACRLTVHWLRWLSEAARFCDLTH